MPKAYDASMTRVSVPVADELKEQVVQHPDDLGLDPEMSESQRFAVLLEAGSRALRVEVRNVRRAEAYAEHDMSVDYQEHLEMSHAAAFEAGGF
jgi:hypothetical protein